MRASVTTPTLLQAGSDRIFQRMVFDLFTIATRLEQVRVHLASRTGISGPQYSLLRAVAVLQGQQGASIGATAEHLGVTSAFIALQSRLLVQRGLLSKRDDAMDRRVSRLALTPQGEHLVEEIIDAVRPINDSFFGGLQKSEFEALAAIMRKLVDSSRQAIVQLSSEDQAASLSSRDEALSD
jgi:DNA-binding MarR family transcriptional regulator